MLGIMSGRLSPPIDDRMQAFPYKTWREEYALAREFGFECMEWVFEVPRMEENPICTDIGIAELRALSEKYGIITSSLMADNFMFERLFGDDKTEVQHARERLKFLIEQAAKANIPVVELPLMGNGSIREQKAQTDLVNNIQDGLALAEKNGITLSLELDLSPEDIIWLKNHLPYPCIGFTFDMGNTAVFGLDAKHIITAMGSSIINVHIKDGVEGRGTVPLGTGETDFDAVFHALQEGNYNGNYIMEAARENLSTSPVKRPVTETINNYLTFIRPYIERSIV